MECCVRFPRGLISFHFLQVITEVLNTLLDPGLSMKSTAVLKWLKWIVAGGSTPKEFYKNGERVLFIFVQKW